MSAVLWIPFCTKGFRDLIAGSWTRFEADYDGFNFARWIAGGFETSSNLSDSIADGDMNLLPRSFVF